MNGKTKKEGNPMSGKSRTGKALSELATQEIEKDKKKSDSSVECVLVIRQDGTIVVQRPKGKKQPIDVTPDLNYLTAENVQEVIPIVYVRSNSGCIYIGGKCYCWK